MTQGMFRNERSFGRSGVRTVWVDKVPTARAPSKLGSPVVPFYPFSFWVPLLKPNSRKKGTLIIKGLLGNLERVQAVRNPKTQDMRFGLRDSRV